MATRFWVPMSINWYWLHEAWLEKESEVVSSLCGNENLHWLKISAVDPRLGRCHVSLVWLLNQRMVELCLLKYPPYFKYTLKDGPNRETAEMLWQRNVDLWKNANKHGSNWDKDMGWRHECCVCSRNITDLALGLWFANWKGRTPVPDPQHPQDNKRTPFRWLIHIPDTNRGQRVDSKVTKMEERRRVKNTLNKNVTMNLIDLFWSWIYVYDSMLPK